VTVAANGKGGLSEAGTRQNIKAGGRVSLATGDRILRDMESWSNGLYTAATSVRGPNIVVKYVNQPTDTKTEALDHMLRMEQLVRANT
jgi:hypothetical protein